MLLFVLHLLGDLLEIGSRRCKLRCLSVLQQDFQGPQRVRFRSTSSAPQMLRIGQVSQRRTTGQEGDVGRIPSQYRLQPQICHPPAEWSTSGQRTRASSAGAARELRSPGAVYPGRGLGSGRLSLVGAIEGAIAGLAALDPTTLPAECDGGAATVAP